MLRVSVSSGSTFARSFDECSAHEVPQCMKSMEDLVHVIDELSSPKKEMQVNCIQCNTWT